MTMNKEAQLLFDKIINKLDKSEKLSNHEISFLKARRSYLSNKQRFRFGDILYFNKQFLFIKLRNLSFMFLNFFKAVFIGILIAILVEILFGFFLKD